MQIRERNPSGPKMARHAGAPGSTLGRWWTALNSTQTSRSRPAMWALMAASPPGSLQPAFIAAPFARHVHLCVAIAVSFRARCRATDRFPRLPALPARDCATISGMERVQPQRSAGLWPELPRVRSTARMPQSNSWPHPLESANANYAALAWLYGTIFVERKQRASCTAQKVG